MGRAGFDLLSPSFFLPGSIASASHILLPKVCCVKPQTGSESGNLVLDHNSFDLGSPSRHPPRAPSLDQPGAGNPSSGWQAERGGGGGPHPPTLALLANVFRGGEGTNIINTKKG